MTQEFPWRRNLRVIWFVSFAAMVGGQLAMPFLPLFIQHELGVSDAGDAAVWAGLALGVSGVGQVFTAPLWGVLADRHGRKAMVVRAQLAIGISNGISAMVGTPWQLVAVRGIQGGFSGMVSATRALVASSVPRERVPYAIGMIQLAIYMGQTLGPTIGGILASVMGFRTAMVCTAAVNITAGIVGWLLIREVRTEPVSAATRAPARPGLLKLLRSPTLGSLIVILFMSSASNICIRPVLPLLIAHVDPEIDAAMIAGLAFAITGISGALGAYAATRVVSAATLRPAVILGAAVAGLGNGLIGFSDNSLAILILLAVAGCANGLQSSATNALLGMHSPAGRQGTTFGLGGSAQALAMSIGPVFGGLTAMLFDLHVAFFASAVMMFVGAALAFTVGDPAPSP